MTQTRFDVLTIGNAIVDVIAPGKPRLSFSKMTAKMVPILIDRVVNGDLNGIQPAYRMDEMELLLQGEKKA